MKTVTLTIVCTEQQEERLLEAMRAVADMLAADGIHAEIKSE